MIPKIIHYCWFGNNPKPKIIKKCMASWKKFCPDYKIIEWNENNFNINQCAFAKQAYEQKKWAFVSDYARFKVLSEYGGIYLDTDVKLIKSIDDLLDKPFTGFESAIANPGLIMGVEKDNFFCNAMIEQYENNTFIVDGKPDLTTVCIRATDYLATLGLERKNETQEVNGFTVYNSNYFNPMNMETGVISIQPETYSVHMYAASWEKPSARLRGKVVKLITRIFGENFANKLRKTIRRKK